ncbi:hypothetical protein [Amycolatopsis australiensis]|uniref:Uncharacterized protein n=1 Tax=Amycolatopsis australiensis TaxID=546364 RepID=A0A1K1QR46_9PSEU|nr:hypothetical protein [Amycolatopsis australiensis]SFW62091.1 hypothetical protein SAMN04489730_2084 [Amycolatopsis australiensis]
MCRSTKSSRNWPATCKPKADSLEVRLGHNANSTKRSFADRLAGRPADVDERGGAVEVQLVDGSTQTLVISYYDFHSTTPGVRAFAGKVVPPLVGR